MASRRTPSRRLSHPNGVNLGGISRLARQGEQIRHLDGPETALCRKNLFKKAAVMFGWLKKDPVRQLENKYADLLKQARDKQRDGDLMGYSDAIAESEEIRSQLDRAEAERSLI